MVDRNSSTLVPGVAQAPAPAARAHHADDGGAVAGGPKRFSAKRKLTAVQRLLRGRKPGGGLPGRKYLVAAAAVTVKSRNSNGAASISNVKKYVSTIPRRASGRSNSARKGVELLKAFPRVPGSPYVIVGDKPGTHLTDLQRHWRRDRKRAGFNDVRIHNLRHIFAANAAASGLTLPMIGKLLGHTQAQTTGRYAHLAADPVHKANADVTRIIADGMAGSSQS